MVKICEVVDGCEDCPRYGDDCDGDKRVEHTDLISRADAVKTVIRKCSPICAWQVGTQQYPDSVVAEINALPSADAVQGWISCSERLPSEDGSYLVTSSFGKVYTAHFYSEHGRWQYNRRGLIEAWMPLPIPYKGGDTE